MIRIILENGSDKLFIRLSGKHSEIPNKLGDHIGLMCIDCKEGSIGEKMVMDFLKNLSDYVDKGEQP
ncbi:MAG: hypothetical protein IKH78_08275 [Ruminococcus sp.]|nr:hypothetical protein [Ruminococcus sp.]